MTKKKRKSLRIYTVEKEMISKNIEAGINSFIMLYTNLLNMTYPEDELVCLFDTALDFLYLGLKTYNQGHTKKEYHILIKNKPKTICIKEVAKIFFKKYINLLIK